MYRSTQSQDALFSRMINDKPSRVVGTPYRTRFGGEGVMDNTSEYWATGTFWDTNSNIRLRTEHEIRREAAQGAHDIHRHDMVTKIKIPGQARVSESGVLTADSCFLEAWGFDLGLRDRAARPTTLWRPVTRDREFGDMLRRPSTTMPKGAEKSAQATTTSKFSRSTTGTFPSRVGVRTKGVDNMDATWDGFEHTVKRDGARRSDAIHACETRRNPFGYLHDKCGIRPAAMYTKKYQKFGESGFRDHDKKERVEGQSGGSFRGNRSRSLTHLSSGTERTDD